jgi:hypothetical protein
MDRLKLDIVERGRVCELRRDKDKIGVDDCEKLLYLALAEGKNQPTQIEIKTAEGRVKKRIYLPQNLQHEELQKRDLLLSLIGKYLKEVTMLPEEIYGKFLDYIVIDELYDHVLMLLEMRGWGTDPEQITLKYDRGDEIEKRDNIVRLTADFLHFNSLATPILLADFYQYPDAVEPDQLIRNLEDTIGQKQSDAFVVYVVDNPFEEDEFRSDLLPVFVEEDKHLKIVAWISPDVIPQNLVPIFDIEQNLVGWLDTNRQNFNEF